MKMPWDQEPELGTHKKRDDTRNKVSCWKDFGDGLNETWFMETPEGYLILHVEGQSESMCYVPDSRHSWGLKEEKE